MTNILSRVYNSTLGIPQQTLYRLWRAIKDDEIDIFSREGLLAPELLPVLGIAASHETDASIEDVIGEQGFGTSLAADILLDPATYLTMGATAAAKAAKATRIASGSKKGGVEFAKYVGDVSQYETAGDLARKISEGIGDGTLKGNKGAKKALGALEEVRDNKLAEVLASGRQEEAMFAIPLLGRLGARATAPELIQKQGSWWKAMNNLIYKEKLGLAKPIDRTTAFLATHLKNSGDIGNSIVGAVTKTAGLPKALMGGFKTPVRPAYMTGIAELEKDGRAAAQFMEESSDFVTRAQKIDPEAFRAMFANKLKEADGDSLEAYLATMRTAAGGRVGEAAALDHLDFLLRPEDSLDDLAELVLSRNDEIVGQYQTAQKTADSQKTSMRVKGARVPKEFQATPVHSWLYQKGQYLRKGWLKGFISDAPFESGALKDAYNNRKAFAAAGEASVRATQKVIQQKIKKISDDTGIPIEQVSKAFTDYQQAYPNPYEFRDNLVAIQTDRDAAMGAVRQLETFANRLRSSGTTLQKAGGKTQESEEFLSLLRAEGQVLGLNIDPFLVKAEDVADPQAVASLLNTPVEGMGLADIKRLRGAVTDPVLKAKLKNMEKLAKKYGLDSPEARLRAAKKASPPKLKKKGEAEVVLERGQKVAADYLLATRDIRRALDRAKNGDQFAVSPMTILRLQRAERFMQGMSKDMLYAALPKANRSDIDYLFDLSDLAARQAGPFERGAQMGFMARLRNKEFEDALATLIGRADQLLPGNQEIQLMQRRVREKSLTLGDMNLLDDALLEAKAPELRKELMELVGEDSIKIKYTDSWEANILTRLSSQMELGAQQRMLDEVFSNPEAAAQDALMGGRVTRVFTGAEVKKELGVDPKTEIGGRKSATLKQEQLEVDLTPQVVEIQTPDGKFRLVDMAELRANGVKDYNFGNKGDSLGQAIVRHDGMHGLVNPGEVIKVDDWVAFGQDSSMQMVRQTVIPQKSELAAVFGIYDTVNFALKRFQTVYRVGHHIGNLVSGIAQTRAAGASAKNTLAGHLWTLQLVSKSTDEGKAFWHDLAARSDIDPNAVTLLGKPGQFIDSLEALLAGKSLDEIDEFAVIDNGVHQYSGIDVIQTAIERNLYGSMQAAEDVRLGGRVTPLEVEKAIKAGKTKTGKAVNSLESATRFPEFLARTSTLKALLLEGHSLDDAIDMAKLAHVDYSDLTKFERQVLKRVIPYYTFSRKYTPFALNAMAKDPSLIAPWVKGIQQSEMMGIDQDGKPILNYGQFELDLGRMNANLDAMMAMAGVTEIVSGIPFVPGSVENPIQDVQSPGFATFSGGAASAAFAMFGAENDFGFSPGSAIQELWDSVFVSRWLESAQEAAQTGDFQPLKDSALSWLIPAKFNAEPEKAFKFQMGMARRALTRLEMQARETKSPVRLESLRRQANELRSAIETVQEDFGR